METELAKGVTLVQAAPPSMVSNSTPEDPAAMAVSASPWSTTYMMEVMPEVPCDHELPESLL
jgi:hypothetical protein